MDIRAFSSLIREYWKQIVLVTLLSVGVSVALTTRMTPRYASNVTFYVSANSGATNPALAYQGVLLSQQAVLSYAGLLTSPVLASSIVSHLGLSMTASQVAAEISAKPIPQSVLLTATVTDTSPRRAQLIASVMSTQFVRLASKLGRSPGQRLAAVSVTVVAPASLPGGAVSPSPARNIGIALALGLIFGIALAAARRTLDTTIKSADQLAALTAGKPVIGTVPFDSTARKHPLVADGSVHPRALEAYRKIRINLQFISIAAPCKMLLLTSPLPQEGKSSVVCNLAIVLAQFGQRIIVVETDLRRPRAGSYLGLPPRAGVTDILAGRMAVDEAIQTWGSQASDVRDSRPAPPNPSDPFGSPRMNELLGQIRKQYDAAVDEAIQTWGRPSFDFLDSGPAPPNPSDLLGSPRMNELLEELRGRYDVILLDAPPVLPSADAAAAAPASDGAILVVRFGKTRIAHVRQAIGALSAVGTPVLGSVLTMVPARQHPEYGHGHGEHRPPHDDPRRQPMDEHPEPPGRTAVGEKILHHRGPADDDDDQTKTTRMNNPADAGRPRAQLTR